MFQLYPRQQPGGKFSDVPPTPLEREQSAQRVKPLPSHKLLMLQRNAQQKIHDFNRLNNSVGGALPAAADDATKQKYYQLQSEAAAAEMILMQVEQGALEDAVQQRFFVDWILWLLGRGNDDDVENTWWGREPLTDDPEVSAYIDAFYTKRQEAKLQIELLKNRAPVGINECYLYYKYIAKGIELSMDNYLGDWDRFHDLIDRKAGGVRNRWSPPETGPYAYLSDPDAWAETVAREQVRPEQPRPLRPQQPKSYKTTEPVEIEADSDIYETPEERAEREAQERAAFLAEAEAQRLATAGPIAESDLEYDDPNAIQPEDDFDTQREKLEARDREEVQIIKNAYDAIEQQFHDMMGANKGKTEEVEWNVEFNSATPDDARASVEAARQALEAAANQIAGNYMGDEEGDENEPPKPLSPGTPVDTDEDEVPDEKVNAEIFKAEEARKAKAEADAKKKREAEEKRKQKEEKARLDHERAKELQAQKAKHELELEKLRLAHKLELAKVQAQAQTQKPELAPPSDTTSGEDSEPTAPKVQAQVITAREEAQFAAGRAQGIQEVASIITQPFREADIVNPEDRPLKETEKRSAPTTDEEDAQGVPLSKLAALSQEERNSEYEAAEKRISNDKRKLTAGSAIFTFGDMLRKMQSDQQFYDAVAFIRAMLRGDAIQLRQAYDFASALLDARKDISSEGKTAMKEEMAMRFKIGKTKKLKR